MTNASDFATFLGCERHGGIIDYIISVLTLKKN